MSHISKGKNKEKTACFLVKKNIIGKTTKAASKDSLYCI